MSVLECLIDSPPAELPLYAGFLRVYFACLVYVFTIPVFGQKKKGSRMLICAHKALLTVALGASYMSTVTACLNRVVAMCVGFARTVVTPDHGTHSPSITIPIIPTTSPFPALNVVWRPKLALDRRRRLPSRDLTVSRRTVCKQAALERRRRRGLRWKIVRRVSGCLWWRRCVPWEWHWRIGLILSV
jgi:hypothetical protein